MIKDMSGHPWIPPFERLYMDVHLQAGDEIGAAMDAYVMKQSMNYTAAGLRSIANANARRDKARLENDARDWFETTRAQVLMNQPRRASRIQGADDNLTTGLRRAQELTNLPSGSDTGNRQRVNQPGLIERNSIVQAGPEALRRQAVLEGDDDEDPALLNDAGEVPDSLTAYERARQDRIAQNNAQMAQLGLLPGGSARLDDSAT